MVTVTVTVTVENEKAMRAMKAMKTMKAMTGKDNNKRDKDKVTISGKGDILRRKRRK